LYSAQRAIADAAVAAINVPCPPASVEKAQAGYVRSLGTKALMRAID